MYIAEFIKKMACREKIPAIVYLILNVAIITFVVHFMFGGTYSINYHTSYSEALDWLLTILLSLLLYAASVAIALSPAGEWLLRAQNRCNGIIRDDYRSRLQPLFNEVYTKARLKDPSISKNVKLYMKDVDYANAYAIGRETICITKGLLNADGNTIKGVLAHEFGHLSHKDTDLIQVISVGNLFITIISFFIRIIFAIAGFFIAFVGVMMGRDEALQGIEMGSIMFLIPNTIISVFMWLWTRLGILLMMSASRNEEYAADAFAKEIGYGDALCSFLSFRTSGKEQGLFAALSSSHPSNSSRLARLKA